MTDKTYKDTFHATGEGLVRKREYPHREAVLRHNQELQKNDVVKDLPGMRPIANFPEGDLKRLAEHPQGDPDLNHSDGRIKAQAIKKFLNTSDGKRYKVGGTSKKYFRFRTNPLAK